MPSLTGSVFASATGTSNQTTGALTSDLNDVIVVGVSIPSASIEVSSVTDSSGNVYTRQSQIIGPETGPSVTGEVWTAPNSNLPPVGGNKITVALSGTSSGTWAVLAASYAGVTAIDCAGDGQSTDSSSVNVGVSVGAPTLVFVAHVMTPSAVTVSGLTTGYADVIGTGTSHIIHQSYLLNGLAGANTFSETISTAQNHVAVLISLIAPTPWSSVTQSGRPYVTVSAGPIANSGADFGSDSTQTGAGPGVQGTGEPTTTNGIGEALNWLGPLGGEVHLLPGSFTVTEGQITIPEHCYIVKEGSGHDNRDNPQSSVIISDNRATGSDSLIVLGGSANALDCGISGVEIYSDYQPQDNYVITIPGAFQGFVRNVHVYAPQAYGCLSFLPSESHIENCEFADGTVAMINVLGGGNDFWIVDCLITADAGSPDGIYVNGGQPGLGEIRGTDITGVGRCVVLDTSAQDVSYIHFQSTHFDGPSAYGLYIKGNHALYSVTLSDCLFDFAGISGLYVTNDNPQFTGVIFAGCTFAYSEEHGIDIEGMDGRAGGIQFHGCVFAHNGTKTAGMYSNVYTSGAGVNEGFYLRFDDCYNGDDVTYSGALVTQYGYDLNNSGGTVIIAGGVARPASFVSNSIFSGTFSPTYVKELLGYNPLGFSIPTTGPGTSPYVYTNTFPFPIRIYFLATATASYTITDPLGNTSGSIPAVSGAEVTLDAGAKIQVTYSTLTWLFYGT